MSENLPIRETSTVHGSKICHPSHCGQCGCVLTEKCPVCQYHHVLGTKFCQANGTSIEAWVGEENVWKVLVQTMKATITVRPATKVIATILAILPAVFFVGGFWVWYSSWIRADYWNTTGDYVFFGFLATVTTFIVSAFLVGFVLLFIGSIEQARRRRLFKDQKYKTLEPSYNVLSV